MEAGPVEALGHGVDLAVVDLRVEVSERLGRRLDALVEHPRRREQPTRGLVVAGRVGVGEGRHGRDQLAGLRLDVRDVVGDGLVGELLLVAVDRRGLAGHGELGEADGGADQLELAGRVVGAGLQLRP